MIDAKIKIGAMELTFHAQNMKDVFRWSAVYGMLPKKCDNCVSEDLHLTHRSPQENDYFSIRCRSCGAEGNFGQHKKGGTLFYKPDTKMTVYIKPDGQNPNQSDNTAPPPGPDDEPF